MIPNPFKPSETLKGKSILMLKNNANGQKRRQTDSTKSLESNINFGSQIQSIQSESNLTFGHINEDEDRT